MTLLKLPLAEWLGHESRLMFFPIAVLLAAWFGGLGPGLLAVALTTVSFTYFFIDPTWQFYIDTINAQQVSFYAFEAMIYCALVYAIRWSRESWKRSEENTRDILKSISDVFCSVGRDWRVSHVNQKFAEVVERPVQEIIGQSLWELFPEYAGTPFESACHKAMYGYEPARLEEQDLKSDRWYEVSVYPSNVGISVYGKDITDRKRYEEGLEQAKRAAEELAQTKTALLSNMSHEVRTPLTGLLLMTEMLAKQISGENQEKVLRIKHGAERLSSLLDAVLTFSQLDAGQVKIDREVVDLAGEVEHVAASLAPLADKKGLFLKIRGKSPCYAFVDDSSFNSVLNNIIGNAIKFTDEGGITLTVEEKMDERVGGSAVVVRVTDTGQGIDPEFLPHIFEEFHQESTGVTRSHEGAGLGLSIAKHLVDLMEGEIEVESQPGEGTTFTITLPGGELPDPNDPMNEGVSLSSNGGGPRVLVMDDDELILELIPELLQGVCKVDRASTAEDAIDRATSTEFDAVLLDIAMEGDMSGEDVLRELREHPHYHNTPIIAMTAYALPGDKKRFLDAGFDGYVSKPFEEAALVRILHQTLVAAKG